MIVGTDIVNSGGKSILGLCSSRTKEISQYFTKIELHDLPKREENKSDRLTKDEKEQIVTKKRSEIMCNFLVEALQNYQN